MCVQVYALLGQTSEERKAFLKGERRRVIFRDYPQEFIKEIILICLLLDPLTNKHCRA